MGERRGGLSGERLPAGTGEFAVDLARHLAAYVYARQYAAGRRVLDAGCGEGYGAASLAEVAAAVVGVDRPEAVRAAAARYRRANLEFRAVDLAALGTLREKFDLVVSFQVIEHLADPPGFLTALRAAARPGGEVLLTTPNRLMSVSENPYHLREYTAAELRALVAGVFPRCRVLGIHGSQRVLAYERARKAEVARVLRWDRLGLRRLLPRALVDFAFPRLALLVRRRLARRAGVAVEKIGVGDFQVRDTELDAALDLLVVAAS